MLGVRVMTLKEKLEVEEQKFLDSVMSMPTAKQIELLTKLEKIRRYFPLTNQEIADQVGVSEKAVFFYMKRRKAGKETKDRINNRLVQYTRGYIKAIFRKIINIVDSLNG